MAFAPPLPHEAPIGSAGVAALPILDLRGLHCPMPVLRTRKALRRMAAGARVVVLCTDPLAAIDIPHFLREAGHALEAQDLADGTIRFIVRKGGCQEGGCQAEAHEERAPSIPL